MDYAFFVVIWDGRVWWGCGAIWGRNRPGSGGFYGALGVSGLFNRYDFGEWGQLLRQRRGVPPGVNKVLIQGGKLRPS